MQQILIHRKQRDPFNRIPKTIAENPELTLAQKGLFTYLLGKPEGWRIITNDVVKQTKDTEYKVRKVMNELRALGYMALVKAREGSQITAWIWLISDEPIFATLEELETLDRQYELANVEYSRLERLRKKRGPNGSASSQLPKNREVVDYDENFQHGPDRHHSKKESKQEPNKARTTTTTAAGAGGPAAGAAGGGSSVALSGGEEQAASPQAAGEEPSRRGRPGGKPKHKELTLQEQEAGVFLAHYTTKLGRMTRNFQIRISQETVIEAGKFFEAHGRWAGLDIVLVCALAWACAYQNRAPGKGNFDRYFYSRRYATRPEKLFQEMNGQTVIEHMAHEVRYDFTQTYDQAWATLESLVAEVSKGWGS